jgi:hypothetical protein
VSNTRSSRRSRSLINSAWYSLTKVEPEWLRCVQAIEALAATRGDAEIVKKVRNIAQEVQEVREVLRTWTQE